MIDPLRTLATHDDAWRIESSVFAETWHLKEPFAIARGVQEDVDFPVVTLTSSGHVGRGECCPVPHYGESLASVLSQIALLTAAIGDGERWSDLHDRVPAGAARNAIDCAMWDLASKLTGIPAWKLLDLGEPVGVATVMTVGLDEPAVMAAKAERISGHGMLKIKLGRELAAESILAVRAAVPAMPLIVDANEAWNPDLLEQIMPVLETCAIAMLEQPLPAGNDEYLERRPRSVLIGADESIHVATDLAEVARRYDVANIKLDKSGGMTEAVRILRGAQELGLQTMIGCMLGTSLAMAPAMLIAPHCHFVDLDAPLLIGGDRSPCLDYRSGRIGPPPAALWG